MAISNFDALDYFEELKGVGFTEAQAKIQVKAMQAVIKQYDESTRKELATKGDVQEIKLEIVKIFAEAANNLDKTKYALLKLQIGIGIALAAIMARGFGWLGF